MSEKCGERCEVYSRVVGYFRPVSNWNKGKKEEFKDRKTFKIPGVLMAFVCVIVLLSGCSHNTGAFTLGTRVNLGIDPQNATANASYTDGLNVIDVSRENASWDVEIDADNGVSVDNRTGNIKGVKRLRREVGPQITGYLVDLADKNPEMAKAYVEAMKLYWQYRLTTKHEAENGAVIPAKEDDASKPQENGTKAQ